jgi:hypothetical protein
VDLLYKLSLKYIKISKPLVAIRLSYLFSVSIITILVIGFIDLDLLLWWFLIGLLGVISAGVSFYLIEKDNIIEELGINTLLSFTILGLFGLISILMVILYFNSCKIVEDEEERLKDLQYRRDKRLNEIGIKS